MAYREVLLGGGTACWRASVHSGAVRILDFGRVRSPDRSVLRLAEHAAAMKVPRRLFAQPRGLADPFREGST